MRRSDQSCFLQSEARLDERPNDAYKWDESDICTPTSMTSSSRLVHICHDGASEAITRSAVTIGQYNHKNHRRYDYAYCVRSLNRDRHAPTTFASCAINEQIKARNRKITQRNTHACGKSPWKLWRRPRLPGVCDAMVAVDPLKNNIWSD